MVDEALGLAKKVAPYAAVGAVGFIIGRATADTVEAPKPAVAALPQGMTKKQLKKLLKELDQEK